MAKGARWSREELLVVFRLYCRTAYGRLSTGNPEIVELAALLGRTPGAVTMKACNFAGLDPVHLARGVTSLANRSRADEELWDEFQVNAEAVAAEAEGAFARLVGRQSLTSQSEPGWQVELDLPEGATETERFVRTRRVQSFFRAAVMASYKHCCAISGLAIRELVNASHIIPWKDDTARRADPRNGIALNALYDRAFDRGLITFDESYRVVVSRSLRIDNPPPFHATVLLSIEGRSLMLPDRFRPDPAALAFHRERVFKA